MSQQPLSHEQRLTRQYFDDNSAFWHDVYDKPQTFAGYRLLAQHEFALSFLQGQSGIQQVLELGCGAGRLAIDLAELGYQVTALDIAPQMIALGEKQAQQRGLEIDWRVGLAEALPDPNGHFDAVIALGLLANIPDLDAILSEIQRVLRSGGMLVTTMPNAVSLDVWIALPRSLPIMIWHPQFRRFVRRSGNLWRRLRDQPLKDPTDIRFGRTSTPYATRRRLHTHGFADLEHHALAFGPMMPLGRNVFSDAVHIRRSQKLVDSAAKNAWLRHFGSLMIYTAKRN